MQREHFISLTEKPFTSDDRISTQLQQVIEQFPYFQTARILFLKSIFDQKSLQYDSQLKITSAYAGDRKKLYRYLQHDSLSKPTSNNGEEILSELKEETFLASPEEEIFSDTEESHVNEKITDDESLKDSLIADDVFEITPVNEDEIQQQNIKPELTAAEILSQRLQELESENKNVISTSNPEAEKSDIKPDEFIQQDESDVDAEHINAEENKLPEEIIPEITLEVEEIKLLRDLTSSPPLKVIKKEEVIKIPENFESNELKNDQKKSFVEWLRSLEGKSEKKKLIQAEAPSEKFSDEASDIKSKPENLEIINKFIESEPRIEPGKTKFYSPANMAKNSLVEHADTVSETLAKIYADQGNIQKAIQSYQSLSLIYPEKRVYFAAQIEKLKNDHPKA
jgi:hypothetical protein